MAKSRFQFNLGLTETIYNRVTNIARQRGVTKTSVATEMLNMGLLATPEGLATELRLLREQSMKSMLELERRLIANERMLHLLIAELRPDVVTMALKAAEAAEPGKRTRAHAVVDDVAEAQATMADMAEKLNQ